MAPSGLSRAFSLQPTDYHEVPRSDSCRSEPLMTSSPINSSWRDLAGLASEQRGLTLPPPVVVSKVGASKRPGTLQNTLTRFRELPQMLAQVGEWWRLQDSEPFDCPLCCETVQERARLRACGDQSHSCCRDCMDRYVNSMVSEGRVDRIRCPLSETCEAVMQRDEVFEVAGSAVFAKYDRFRKMRADPNLRQCPQCSELCSPLRDVESGAIIPAMSCGSCKSEFCFYHSNAHVGKPCTALLEQLDDDERLAVTLSIEEETHNCPHCNILTQKSSGCNHMTCRQCGGHWCWLCGDKIGSVSSHYSADNPNGCEQFAGYQFWDGDEARQRPAGSCVFAVCFFLMFYLFFALISWAFGIITNWVSSHWFLVILFCCVCGLCPSKPRAAQVQDV